MLVPVTQSQFEDEVIYPAFDFAAPKLQPYGEAAADVINPYRVYKRNLEEQERIRRQKEEEEAKEREEQIMREREEFMRNVEEKADWIRFQRADYVKHHYRNNSQLLEIKEEDSDILSISVRSSELELTPRTPKLKTFKGKKAYRDPKELEIRRDGHLYDNQGVRV